MGKIFSIIVFLIITSLAQAEIPDNMPQSIYDQIIQQVIQDKGYLDTSAVQEGIAQWQLQQPLPATDGTLIETGNCTTCNADTQGTSAQFKKPRNIKVKAKKHTNGKYPSVLKIKWKKPKKLKPSLRSQYKVSHYLIYISKDGQSYEVLRKDAKYKKNGKLKKKQKIKFKDRTTGSYTVQVQAVYVPKTAPAKSAQKSINKGASSSSISPWTSGTSFQTQSKYTTVGQYTGAIHSCLNNNGFADSTLLTAVDPSIDCTGYNLQNADIDLMANLTNIRSIIIANNPAVTDVSLLANLNYLEYLDLSNNPNITLPNFTKFEELITLKLANMGLTTVPDLSTNDLLTTLDLNDNAITSGFDLLPTNLDVLDVKSSAVNPCDTIPPTKSIDSLTLSGAAITSIESCANVLDLRYLTVNDAPNLELINGGIGIGNGSSKVSVSIDSFAGFCGLTFNNTNLEILEGSRPINRLNLLNNTGLQQITTIKPAYNIANSQYPDLIPASVRIEGSSSMDCSAIFEKKTLKETLPILQMQGVSVFTKVNGVDKNSLACPYTEQADAHIFPTQCKPDPLASIDVYEDVNTQRRYITWAQNPDYDYTLWGVTYFKIQGLSNLNGDVVYERNIALGTESSLVQNSFEPNVYTIRACTPQQCGDAITTSAPFSQGLSRVTDLTINWLNLQGNSKDYKFSFNYPSNLPIGLSWVESAVNVTSNSLYSTGSLWASKVFSNQRINGNGSLEFTTNRTTTAAIGLSRESSLQGYQGIDYGLYLRATTGHGILIYENSTQIVLSGKTWVIGDVFKIERTNGNIVYYQNNQIIHTSAVSSNVPLRIHANFYGEGGDFTNISLTATDSNSTLDAGAPTYFEIHSDFTQNNGETLIQTIPASHGNQTEGWLSDTYLFSPGNLIGNSFSVSACNQFLGCGVPTEVIIQNPVTSTELSTPNLYAVSLSSGAGITLKWTVQDANNIDYYEVKETQPYMKADFSYGQSLPFNYPERLFFLDTKDINEVSINNFTTKLTRQSRGKYTYQLRACHRNRVNGDVCSLESVNMQIIVVHSPPNTDSVSNPRWYEYTIDGTTKYGLIWDLESSNSSFKPDYFYISKTAGNSSCAHTDLTISYAEKIKVGTANKWTINSDCDDVGNETQWVAKACFNGIGCSGNSSPFLVGDPNKKVAPPEFLVNTSNSPVLGGPGDLNPGMWWNPDLAGTGWHFYWASELRYDSNFNDPTTNSKYGKTYDLIGYWLAYQEMHGVWTPVWFEARMKQVIPDPQNQSAGFFQGDIYYHEKTGEALDVGNIQINFGSDNQHAELIIDPDHPSIFAQNTSATDLGPYTVSQGKYHLQIQDFEISNITDNNGNNPAPRFQEKNNADHYSGLWQYFDANNNAEVSVLTWIERSSEVTTIATFDSAGLPVWYQGQTCSLTSCNRSSGDYFTDYYSNDAMNKISVVTKGFNPLANKPNDYNVIDNNEPIGNLGRCYSSSVSVDEHNRFKEGLFWMKINNNLIYPDADGGSFTRNIIKSYGTQTNDCSTNTSMLPLVKKASLHDIRFFINGNDETVTTCDPNVDGDCVVKFTWYTDDFFPSIEPFYSLNGSSYQKLSDICPGVPLDNFVVTQFECTIAQPGNYTFQLHKDDYDNSANTIVIAESQEMTIQSCTSSNCLIGVGAPATPPQTETQFGPMSAHPDNDLIGTTSGTFDIDESGNANYSIPIFAPAGVGGLAPQLALSYSSASGNGIAGVGWNISGTSSITRCLTSPEHDPGQTFYPAISLTEDDALCIDGQRMFKDADGNYRTEIDSFNKIMPIASNATGPTSFIVYTKSGEIREYGSSDNNYKKAMDVNGASQLGTGAQIIANDGSGAIHTWLLNKIEDRNGNKMHFVWSTYQGENYLAQVKWTMPTSGKNHYQIDFNYSASRTDATHHYGIGTEYKAYRNLDYISTLIRPNPTSPDSDMQEVRRLKLNYETTANATGLLRLASIEQCLNGAGTCLQPVEFEWDNGNQIANLFSNTLNSSDSIGKLADLGYGAGKYIDVNGDGILEYIFIRNWDDGNWIITNPKGSYHIAYQSNPSNTNSTCQSVGSNQTGLSNIFKYVCDMDIVPYDVTSSDIDFTPSSWFVYDFNNDGYQDIISANDMTSFFHNWYIFYSNGTIICKDGNGVCNGYEPKGTSIPVILSLKNSDDYQNNSTQQISLKDYFEDVTKQGNPDYWIHKANFSDINNDGLPEIIQGSIVAYMTVNDQNQIEFAHTLLDLDGSNIDFDTYEMFPDDCVFSTIFPCPGPHVDPNDPTKNDVIFIDTILHTSTDLNGDGYSDLVVEYYYLVPCSIVTCNFGFQSTRRVSAFSLHDDGTDVNLKLITRIGDIVNDASTAYQVRSMDINGDGLSDFVFKDIREKYNPSLSLGWYYQINQGTNNLGKIEFSEVRSFNLDDIADFREDVNDDLTDDEVGRTQKVEFLDYDGDGDIDILYPPNYSQASNDSDIFYKVRKFSLANPYSVSETTNLKVGFKKTGRKLKQYTNTFTDFNGDGNIDYVRLLRGADTQQAIVYGVFENKPKNKITKITNIVDNKQTSIEIAYKSATDPTVYTKNTGSFAEDYGQGSPVFDILAPMYLVKSVTKNASGYGSTTMDYHYSGLRVQGGGRGSLGFATITSTDTAHNMTTETSYRQDFPYIGMPESTLTYYGAELVSESYSFYDAKTSTVNGHTTYFPYLKRSYEKNYALNTTASGLQRGNATKTIITEFGYGNSSYPAYGNVTTSDVYTCSGSTTMPAISASVDTVCSQVNNQLITQKTTSNAYEPENTADWILARLSTTTVTSKRKVSAGNYDSKTKSSDFSYYATTGQLKQEHVSGGVKIIHEYDSSGQEIKTYQCTSDIANCQSVPTTARQASASTIHRYKETIYGDGTVLWPEYAYASKEPFVSGLGINFINQSTDIGNNLTGGVANLKITSTVDAFDIYGNPTKSSDIFGNYIRTAYGDMGEAHATASNTGSLSTTTKKWCSQAGSYCPTNASISIVTETLGAPTSRKYLDVMGREVRSQTRMLKGEWSTVDTYYDALGRTFKQSEPYVRNANNTLFTTPTYTNTTYDDLDRIDGIVSTSRCIEPVNPTGTCVNTPIITLTTYTNLAVTTTNPKEQNKTQYFDESGKVERSVDSAGDSVYYSYDAHDNLIKTSFDGHDIVMAYDNFGRKTSMNDPDKGNWTYTYNQLGEMLTQTNNGKQTHYYYDIRGRKYLQTADDVRSIWDYDVGGNYGLLVNEFSIGRGTQALATYPHDGVAQIKNYYFDTTYHRPTSTEITVYDGEGGDNTPYNYTTSQTYDAQGRIFQSFDATNNGVLFQYNNYGYQSITRDAADGTLGKIYHEILNTNARGQVLYEKFYNKFYTSKTYENSTGFVQTIITTNETNDEVQNQSFAFDEVGNLIRRTDNNPQTVGTSTVLTENFEYDNRNRLLLEFLNDSQSKSYQYDKTGNITYVNGGQYVYAQTGNAGPHAVTSAKGNTYQYDISGNVTHKTSATTTSDFYYTSFDKPYKITAGDWTSEIVYNANNSRYIRKDIKVSDRTVTHYLGSVEYVYKTNGSKKAKRYIGNLIIDIIDDEINHTSWGYNYLLKDHIGSTHKVVNKQGNSITAMSFDAWGARRKSTAPDHFNTPIYKTYDLFGSAGVWERLGQSIENTTNRGFTGHEHFDQVGIIHMNGRIYDPEIGRFLQADPMVQDPYDTQSLNRYSYVMNNPLSYTDPSGYLRLRKGWWRMPVAIAITVATSGAASAALAGTAATATTAAVAGSVSQAFTISVVGGFLSGGVATGTLKGAVKGGIFAAVTFGIGHGAKTNGVYKGASAFSDGERLFLHAVAGGVSAELDGGKFGHGFVSSFLSSGADKLGLENITARSGRIIANAIVAGTISEVTGGKFANGAMSAAFRVAFNEFGDKFESLNNAFSEQRKAIKAAKQKFESKMNHVLKVGHMGIGEIPTYEEAIWLYQNGNGKGIDIDGRVIKTKLIQGRTVAWPILDSTRVFGQVTYSPKNPNRLFFDTYDWHYQDNPNWEPLITVRNILNEIGEFQNGKGTPFNWQFRYDDKFFKP